MTITIFLSQFWGWFLVITSLVFLLGKKTLMEEMFRIAEDRGFTLISGYLAFIIGLVTVILHNVWVADLKVIITIFGWLSLLKGIVRMGFPEAMQKSVSFFKERIILIKVLLVVMFVLGVSLIRMSY